MTTNNILRFPVALNRMQTPTAATKLTVPRADLHDLSATAALINHDALMLGENVLLPVTVHPRFRYACSAYLVSQDGRKALPVVCCRGWFHAPLPAQAHSHPVWADLRGGIAAAAERLADSPFSLEGAVSLARSWMRNLPAARYERTGSEVLLSKDSSLYCGEQTSPPPADAMRSSPAMIRPTSRVQRWELLAA